MNSNNKRLNVRMSEKDYRALASNAKACGLTISDFVRFRCIEDVDYPRIVIDSETFKALYANERTIGGLLNQLLRHANTWRQDFPQLVGQVQTVLVQLQENTKEISELLAETRFSNKKGK